MSEVHSFLLLLVTNQLFLYRFFRISGDDKDVMPRRVRSILIGYLFIYFLPTLFVVDSFGDFLEIQDFGGPFTRRFANHQSNDSNTRIFMVIFSRCVDFRHGSLTVKSPI